MHPPAHPHTHTPTRTRARARECAGAHTHRRTSTHSRRAHIVAAPSHLHAEFMRRGKFITAGSSESLPSSRSLMLRAPEPGKGLSFTDILSIMPTERGKRALKRYFASTVKFQRSLLRASCLCVNSSVSTCLQPALVRTRLSSSVLAQSELSEVQEIKGA